MFFWMELRLATVDWSAHFLRGGKTVPLRIKRLAQRSDLVAILLLVAMACLLGSGMLYLGERVHGPEQTRMIDTGPPDPPISIE
jgi:hypothetical protein